MARPNLIAHSTAPLLSTGSTPGSAMSTAEACVLGAAPNAVEVPEKILDAVDSCACVSSPTTTSHSPMAPDSRRRTQVPVGGLLVPMRDLEQACLAEVGGVELQPDRQAAAGEPARYGHRGQAGQVGGDGEDVVQVHL